eukprot:scaffold3600_cov387-Prasinococcus_capsulatus_cf.AAC.15
MIKAFRVGAHPLREVDLLRRARLCPQRHPGWDQRKGALAQTRLRGSAGKRRLASYSCYCVACGAREVQQRQPPPSRVGPQRSPAGCASKRAQPPPQAWERAGRGTCPDTGRILGAQCDGKACQLGQPPCALRRHNSIPPHTNVGAAGAAKPL